MLTLQELLRKNLIHQTIKSREHIRKKKKVIGLMADELSGRIMKEFVALTPKMYSYLMHDGHVNKRAKDTKKCVIKQEVNFEDYKNCLQSNMAILQSRRRFRNEAQCVHRKIQQDCTQC